MNRIELIAKLAKRTSGTPYKPKGLNQAVTGAPSAIKERKRCEWKRGGNLWYNGNYGVSHKSPQEVAAGLPKEPPAPKVEWRPKFRHGDHPLTEIAEKLRRR